MAEDQLYKIYKSTMSQIADCTRAIAGINFELTPEEIIRYLKNYANLSFMVNREDFFKLFSCTWAKFTKPKATEEIDAYTIDDMRTGLNDTTSEFNCVPYGFSFTPQTIENIEANNYSGEGIYEFIDLNPKFIDSSYERLAKIRVEWVFPSQPLSIDRGQARVMKAITNDLGSITSISVVTS